MKWRIKPLKPFFILERELVLQSSAVGLVELSSGLEISSSEMLYSSAGFLCLLADVEPPGTKAFFSVVG